MAILENMKLVLIQRILSPFLFKDQIAANAVRRQLRDLSNKIAVTLQSIFIRTLKKTTKP